MQNLSASDENYSFIESADWSLGVYFPPTPHSSKHPKIPDKRASREAQQATIVEYVVTIPPPRLSQYPPQMMIPIIVVKPRRQEIAQEAL